MSLASRLRLVQGSSSNMKIRSALAVLAIVIAAGPALPALRAQTGSAAKIHDAKVTVLSTMLTDDKGVGEWGFSALVEIDGRRLLFDTGGRPDTVLKNAAELGIDLSSVEDVVLSHNHWDHTSGLVTLRREMMKKNPKALSRAFVGKGIFLERFIPTAARGSDRVKMDEVKRDYESLGGKFIELSSPQEWLPGAWLTGPVPRTYPEKNWPPGPKIRDAAGNLIEDNIPEDQSLVLDTDKGIVVLTGCGHAGIINISEYARKVAPSQGSIYAVLGGMHLFAAKEESLSWTANKFKELGVAQIMGAHCTGLQPVYFFRDRLGLSRSACLVGAVGATFDLQKGLAVGNIAQ